MPRFVPRFQQCESLGKQPFATLCATCHALPQHLLRAHFLPFEVRSSMLDVQCSKFNVRCSPGRNNPLTPYPLRVRFPSGAQHFPLRAPPPPPTFSFVSIREIRVSGWIPHPWRRAKRPPPVPDKVHRYAGTLTGRLWDGSKSENPPCLPALGQWDAVQPQATPQLLPRPADWPHS